MKRAPIFTETAFRDPRTGEVYRSGKVHNFPESVPRSRRLESGFVDRRGRFLTRIEAANVASRYDLRFGTKNKMRSWTGESDTFRFHRAMPPDDYSRESRTRAADALRAMRSEKRRRSSGWDESQHPRDENGRWEPK